MPLRVTFSGDEKDLARAMRAIQKEQEKTQKGFTKITDEEKKVIAESKRLERQGKKTFESTRTPMERHQMELQRIKKQLEAGVISQDTYTRAVKKQNDEFARSQNKLSALDKSLAGVAARYLSIGGLAGTAMQAMQQANQVRVEASQKGQEGATGLSKLAQLAGGDKAKLKQLTDAATNIFKSGGASTLSEASNLAFELESSGALDESKLFSDLKDILDPAVAAKSAGVLTQALGKSETGSFRDILSKGVAAAGPATGVDISQLLEGASRGGATARELDISDEELLGATSVLAQTTGSGSLAGTQVAALLKQLDKGGFGDQIKDQGLNETLQAIRNRVAGGENVRDILGDRAEAITAFRQLEFDRLGTRIGEVREAQESNRIQAVIDSVESNELISTTRAKRRADNRLELVEQKAGIARTERDTEIAKLQEARGGRSSFEFVDDFERWIGSGIAGDEAVEENTRRRREMIQGRRLSDDEAARLRGDTGGGGDAVEAGRLSMEAAVKLHDAVQQFAQTGDVPLFTE